MINYLFSYWLKPIPQDIKKLRPCRSKIISAPGLNEAYNKLVLKTKDKTLYELQHYIIDHKPVNKKDCFKVLYCGDVIKIFNA